MACSFCFCACFCCVFSLFVVFDSLMDVFASRCIRFMACCVRLGRFTWPFHVLALSDDRSVRFYVTVGRACDTPAVAGERAVRLRGRPGPPLHLFGRGLVDGPALSGCDATASSACSAAVTRRRSSREAAAPTPSGGGRSEAACSAAVARRRNSREAAVPTRSGGGGREAARLAGRHVPAGPSGPRGGGRDWPGDVGGITGIFGAARGRVLGGGREAAAGAARGQGCQPRTRRPATRPGGRAGRRHDAVCPPTAPAEPEWPYSAYGSNTYPQAAEEPSGAGYSAGVRARQEKHACEERSDGMRAVAEPKWLRHFVRIDGVWGDRPPAPPDCPAYSLGTTAGSDRARRCQACPACGAQRRPPGGGTGWTVARRAEASSRCRCKRRVTCGGSGVSRVRVSSRVVRVRAPSSLLVSRRFACPPTRWCDDARWCD